MNSLPKPKVFNTPIKTKKARSNLVENRYYLKNTNKRTLDQLVKENLEERLQNEGKFYLSLSYWHDRIYTSDFILVSNTHDIENIRFDEEFMRSSGEENNTMTDNTKIKVASIFTMPVKRVKVGESEYNDCLYDCLCEAFLKTQRPTVLKCPETFKQWLGLQRGEKVDLIECLPKIEDELQLNIITTHDYKYTSKTDYPRTIKLRVEDEHVTKAYAIDGWKHFKHGYEKPAKKNNRSLRKYPIMYRIVSDSEEVEIAYYERIRTGTLMFEIHPLKWLSEFYTSNKKKSAFFLKEVEDNEDPREQLVKMIEIMKKFQSDAYKCLKGKMKNNLNPFHSNFNIRPMATHYFYTHAPKSIHNLSDFIENEERWLERAMTGGLLYSEPYRSFNCFQYDYNSHYPSLMLKTDFITRKGIFKTITKLPEEIEEYCIIRCIITGYDNKLFQTNKNSYYTGYDVITAKEQNYNIELICDGQPNVLEYPENTRISGEEVFGDFVNDLYKLKSETEGTSKKIAKCLLNCLWGYMFKKDIKTFTTDRHEVYVNHLSQVKRCVPRITEGEKAVYKVYTYKASNYGMSTFTFKHARFVPFLTALGRRQLYQDIEPIKKYVKHIHTDGFITTKSLKKLKGKLGDELGQMRKNKGECDIHHVNKSGFKPYKK